MESLLGLTALGIGISVISVFLGFGGGTLMVPFLPLLLGIDVKTAIATSLTVASFNALINTHSFQKKKLIDWKIVFKLVIPAMIFAFLAARATHLAKSDLVETFVSLVFIALIIVTWLGPQRAPRFLTQVTPFNQILIGASTGAISGLSGIAGGAFFIPIMMAGRWIEDKKISPTGNAINLVAAGTSASTLFFSSEVILWREGLVILMISQVFSIYLRPKQSLLSANARRYSLLVYLIFVTVLQIFTTHR